MSTNVFHMIKKYHEYHFFINIQNLSLYYNNYYNNLIINNVTFLFSKILQLHNISTYIQ